MDITVIIVCYNFGFFLSEAFESVLNQTFQPKKIIIIDDTSTDNTQKICSKLQKKYPSLIQCIKNIKNMGTVYCYNQGIDEVKTKYYAILDGDDVYYPTFLEKAKHILDNQKNVAIVYSDLELFGPRAQQVYWEIDADKEIRDGSYLITFPDFDINVLHKKNYIHNASLTRTETSIRAGKYRITDKREIDHDLFLRMVADGSQAYRVKEPLLRYRQHSIQQTSAKHYVNETYTNELLVSKSQEELIQDYILLEKKIIYLQKNLYKIISSKFYYLWQIYCRIRNSFKHD